MKKILIVFMSTMLCVGFSYAEPAEMKCPSIYAATIAASGSANTSVLQTERKSGYEGFFSVQPIFSGAGTLKISYQISNNGTTWSPAVEIVAAAISGTVYPYPAAGVSIVSGFQRFVLAETTTTDEVVITGLYRCAQ